MPHGDVSGLVGADHRRFSAGAGCSGRRLESPARSHGDASACRPQREWGVAEYADRSGCRLAWWSCDPL